jgi:hypothetical protein
MASPGEWLAPWVMRVLARRSTGPSGGTLSTRPVKAAFAENTDKLNLVFPKPPNFPGVIDDILEIHPLCQNTAEGHGGNLSRHDCISLAYGLAGMRAQSGSAMPTKQPAGRNGSFLA